MTETVLGRLDDVPDGGSAALTMDRDGRSYSVIAVRKDGHLYAYLNICPHRGLPLDFRPGQFLDLERKYILCSNHAALFRIEDGACVEGPCGSGGLLAVPVQIKDGLIVAGEWRRPA